MEQRMLRLADKSNVAKHRIINFIQPMLIVLTYIRAERERYFKLHAFAWKKWYHTFLPQTITNMLITYGIIWR